MTTVDPAGDRFSRLDDAMKRHADEGEVAGLVWLVAHGGAVHAGAAGTHGPSSTGVGPVRRDSIFRISSTTKPIAAAAALALVDEGVFGLDDPVEPWLPELADRRVLAPGATTLDDTVPARRSITVRDLLTFRMGLGMDFTAPWPQPLFDRMAELGLGPGAPEPGSQPEPDEWMRRLGTLPLQHQPGERWLYHTSADVLGVLVARASGQPFEVVLGERILEPLGMADTGFSVPAAQLGRFGPCYGHDPGQGERVLYDPADGQWSRPPAFPSGGDGLVSTVDDLLAFATMLRDGGVHRGRRILAASTVAAMTTNHLTAGQLAAAAPDPSGATGWGFGVGVQVRATPTRSVGAYGWDGGLGSSWATDPVRDLVGILLTNQAWASPVPPPVVGDFWAHACAAVDR